LDTALKPKTLLGYGVADAGQALVGTLIGFYQMYFFTDVMRLPLHNVATLFLMTKILDMVCFPLFGTLVDRMVSRGGTFRRWLAWIILPFLVSSMMLFAFDPAWNIQSRVTYTYGVVSVFVMVSALLSVVYTGLVSAIASKASERAKLSTIRFVFAFGAGTAATFSIKYIVDYFGGKQGGGFYYVALIFSIVAALALYITYITTAEYTRDRNEASGTIFEGIPLLFKNRVFLAPLVATAFSGLCVTIKSQTTLYFITYAMRREDITSYMLTGGTISCAAGVALVGLFINRIDRKRLFIGLMASNALFISLIYFFAHGNAPLIITFHCMNSLVGGACAPVIFSIYSDIVDYFDHAAGYRSPALINSLTMLAGRLGNSLGMVSGPLALAYFHYQPDQAQTDAAVNGISLMFTAIPACFALLSALAMMLYRITNNQAEKTAHELLMTKALHKNVRSLA
jgi:glycoside/pentoside/hexuronide:cation symporter, GPH family